MTRQFAILAVVVVAWLLVDRGQAAPNSPKNGPTIGQVNNFQIVLSADAIPSEKYAAQELQTFYQQATGVQLPIRRVAKDSGNLFVGRHESLSKLGYKIAASRKYGKEELQIIVDKQNIAILGGRPRGTLYGVYTFLEDQLDIRFLTAKVTHIPLAKASQHLKACDYRYKPKFEFRMYLKPELLDAPEFAVRRRQNSTGHQPNPQLRLTKKFGGAATGGVFLHNNFQMPVSFRDHPEMYGLVDGRRQSKQPCLSNPETRRLVTNHILKYLKGYGPGTTIPLAQNDAHGFCQCRRCMHIQAEGLKPCTKVPGERPPQGFMSSDSYHIGPPSAVIIDFMNHVAREVAKRRPDLWVGTEAYVWSSMPPRRTKALPNVKVQIATYTCDFIYAFDDPRSPINKEFLGYIKGWRKVCNNLFIWTYDMNARELWLPFPNLRSQGNHLRTFVKNNGRGVFMQGHAKNAEFSDLRAYVMTSLIWNPNLDINQVIDEFLRLYYGKSGPAVRQWIELIHDQAVASDTHSNVNGMAENFGLDQQLGDKGLKLFDKAMASTKSAEIRNRLEKLSVMAVRLAIEPIWYNAMEAKVQARAHKKPLKDMLKPLTPQQLERQHRLYKRIQMLAQKHGMHSPREGSLNKRFFDAIDMYLAKQKQ